MDYAILIPITMFVCTYLSIKAVVDARTRRQMVAINGSEDMLRSLLDGEEARRRQASLRWGTILLALALGFAGIEAFGWTEATPGVFALLLGATGIGNLVAFALARRTR
ncbi:hypothetical protein [Luteimonas sp. 100069]|uniref:hypothetical protein n=1 Tax=Luteimonas sp. 100069 TaxID=2006109 RepID=UPI000F5097A8|nr:hypothetical protein [Luteimonas sp. 100069]RPD84047.1 hypothetical protein EGK76_13190 [Luteimonas sp. 100069]